jgi:hypothetical protein
MQARREIDGQGVDAQGATRADIWDYLKGKSRDDLMAIRNELIQAAGGEHKYSRGMQAAENMLWGEIYSVQNKLIFLWDRRTLKEYA